MQFKTPQQQQQQKIRFIRSWEKKFFETKQNVTLKKD